MHHADFSAHGALLEIRVEFFVEECPRACRFPPVRSPVVIFVKGVT